MSMTCSEGTRSLVGRAFALAALLVFLMADLSGAQANNGAVDLLLPIGARATAMGGAFVAEQGSEAIWWNPAGLARLTRPEFSLDHFETIFIKGDAASIVFPIARVGVFGISGRFFNNGEFETTDSSDVLGGNILARTVVLGATFAAPFGPNVTGGITYHLYQGRSDCSGVCTSDVFATSALDAGVQLRPIPGKPLTLGFEVRNVGPSIQVRDAQQADPLPTRVHLGASYDPTIASLPAEVHLRGTAEVVTTASLGMPELRFGAQLGYVNAQSTLLVRAGYVHQSGVDQANGPSLGLGLAQGRVSLDITRVFENFSTGLGKPPTYISIRVGL